ncbi:hypothetical protein VTK73DRAFT_5580 [Phialemonium thermophilum]|uniref:F-box domain-containing protein n=1 Tax=Phialemonium thermophilum TaxID=223376 RepID=A0ABR3WMR1_9PEZI
MPQNHQGSPLLACPDEVLLLIIRQLTPHDLSTICRVSKELRRVAEPSLYAEIRLDWDPSLRHPIGPLLRTVVHRPELARATHRVILSKSFEWSSYRAQTLKILVSTVDLEAPVSFVASAPVSHRNVWLEALRDGAVDAFVAVFLCHTPNLTHLVIEGEYFRESRFLGFVLRSAIGRSPESGLRVGFEHLESVKLEPSYDIYRARNNTADVLPVFYLPSIRHIYAAIDNPASFAWPLSGEPPSPPHLQSLDLRYIREPFLGPLLSVAAHLRSLHWQWLYTPDIQDEFHTPSIDLTQVAAALLNVGDILEDLTLTAIGDTGGDPDYPTLTMRGSLRPLSRFGRLKRLAVPFALLMGFVRDFSQRLQDFLPSSLEYLCITDHLYVYDQYEWEDDDILFFIQPWLETYQASTPHLRGVTLFFVELSGYNQNCKNEFLRLCARVGVPGKITDQLADVHVF